MTFVSAVVEIGLVQAQYMVYENSGGIQVCAAIVGNGDCLIPFPIFLNFSTEDGTGI